MKSFISIFIISLCFSTSFQFTLFDGFIEFHFEEHVFVFGHTIAKFTTEDKSLDYMSIVDGNMRVCTIAIGSRHTYFKSQRYKFNKKHKI